MSVLGVPDVFVINGLRRFSMVEVEKLQLMRSKFLLSEASGCCEVSRRSQNQCYNSKFFGGVPEWLKGADCKSVGLRLHWFESSPLHQFLDDMSVVPGRCWAAQMR